MNPAALVPPVEATPVHRAPSKARERILEAAYDLFSQRGIRAVGVDAIIDRSGVARQTLYRHFGSKGELVLAYLERRDEVWTKGMVKGGMERRASAPSDRMLAIFDVFDEWFRRPDFEGCSFINVLLEHPDPADPIHRASVAYLAAIRAMVEDQARQAGIADAEDFARKWHTLMKGSIVAAAEGDLEAARRAREVGVLLLSANGIH